MTNTQLYLSIGLPILTVITGFLLNWRTLSSFRAEVNRRFDGVDKRMDRTDARIDRVDARIDHVDTELAAIRNHLTTFYSVTGVLQGRIDELSKAG